MKQYLDLLKTIKEKGTHKPAAREGMPGSTSLFGYQFRHNLQEGFPLLTTKKIFWKGVVTELLWFLRGDTNIKYLVDNGVNIWNEDAYNYYLNKCKVHKRPSGYITLEAFIEAIKDDERKAEYIVFPEETTYKLGDCGYQYGKIWRNWEYAEKDCSEYYPENPIDQIKNLIDGLKNNPESRRHIVTSIDPTHDKDLALYWCHAMFQFNCRPINTVQNNWKRYELLLRKYSDDQLKEKYKDDPRAAWLGFRKFYSKDANYICDLEGIPKYYLDCQLYQRSADVVLGVPFNIASYALLTHIIAKICNMIPGEFIHTFGDVHIYDNHMDAVDEQLKRTPTELPTLKMKQWDEYMDIDSILSYFLPDDFQVENYNPQPAIKAELSTGLKK